MLFGSLLLLWRVKPKKLNSNRLCSCSSQFLNPIVTLHNRRANVPLCRLKKPILVLFYIISFPLSLSLSFSHLHPIGPFSLSPLSFGSHPLASPSQVISPSISETRVSHKPISPSISKNPYFHHSLSISQTHFFLGHFRYPIGTNLERRSRHKVVTGGALISARQ